METSELRNTLQSIAPEPSLGRKVPWPPCPLFEQHPYRSTPSRILALSALPISALNQAG